jgi:hypothetical protein
LYTGRSCAVLVVGFELRTRSARCIARSALLEPASLPFVLSMDLVRLRDRLRGRIVARVSAGCRRRSIEAPA